VGNPSSGIVDNLRVVRFGKMKRSRNGNPSERKENSFRFTAPVKRGSEGGVITVGPVVMLVNDVDFEGPEEGEGSRDGFQKALECPPSNCTTKSRLPIR
jgi:hypothetical protein